MEYSVRTPHTDMKCLSIFKGHEHILGDKIAKFETRALATLQSLRSIQCTIYSSLCLYQTYAIDIVIRDVRDRDYNTSKANKPISYNLRHFIIKQYIYRLIRLYETETFTCYTIDNSKIRNSMYIILLLEICCVKFSCIYVAHKRKKYENKY
jgi:hypothetical protein